MEELIKDSIKEEILIKSAEIFIQFGYKKTTMNDIAKKIGKAKGAIYYYYKSKEEIFENVIRNEAKNLLGKILFSIEEKSSITEKLETYIEQRTLNLYNVALRYKILKDELLDFLPIIEKIREPYHLQEVNFIKDLLVEGKEKGDFSIENPEIGALTLVSALKGLEIPLFISNDFILQTFNIQQLTTLLLYGLIRQIPIETPS